MGICSFKIPSAGSTANHADAGSAEDAPQLGGRENVSNPSHAASSGRNLKPASSRAQATTGGIVVGVAAATVAVNVLGDIVPGLESAARALIATRKRLGQVKNTRASMQRLAEDLDALADSVERVKKVFGPASTLLSPPPPARARFCLTAGGAAVFGRPVSGRGRREAGALAPRHGPRANRGGQRGRLRTKVCRLERSLEGSAQSTDAGVMSTVAARGALSNADASLADPG
jgi:hypothetical protein